MKFEQLIEEMKKQSGLSYYYFQMLYSIGQDWEVFLEKWINYTLVSEKDKNLKAALALELVKRARSHGERLGYIFKRIREVDEK